VVISREVSDDYKYRKDHFHDGGIQITVVTICGKSGSQNSISPKFGVGETSYIYSYGGDSEIVGDVLVGDIVYYAATCEGACIYGFYLFGRPATIGSTDDAVSSMCSRFGGCDGVRP
jgi:hypothetical protein